MAKRDIGKSTDFAERGECWNAAAVTSIVTTRVSRCVTRCVTTVTEPGHPLTGAHGVAA